MATTTQKLTAEYLNFRTEYQTPSGLGGRYKLMFTGYNVETARYQFSVITPAFKGLKLSYTAAQIETEVSLYI